MNGDRVMAKIVRRQDGGRAEGEIVKWLVSVGDTVAEHQPVVVAPTVLSMLWFAVFGGAGIYIEMFGSGGLAEWA